MGKISLLDCTLRDGGYINDWNFGEQKIKGICKRIAQTGIEFIEVGFIKGDKFDPNRSVFPDVESISKLIAPKSSKLKYVAMLDMSAPVPLDRIPPYDGTSIDGIRVIFKKEKIEEGFAYCKRIKELGYWLSVNFVGTDLYSDKEFIEGIEKFNSIKPDTMVIVDSFGLIKRKHFLRLVYIADNNMAPEVMLSYHAHNNLQQAFGNAEALVDLNLKRDICIDACVFGMGRGAGNLNLELFAEYMNENYDTNYRLEPMLEIMDEYLEEIYRKKQWGYSLPLYLSASNGCHPNYAIYIAEKDSLNVKSFNEYLKSIPNEEKAKFSKEKAERYYKEYQDKYVDDKKVVAKFADLLVNKDVFILAPGKSLLENEGQIVKAVNEIDCVVFSLNFIPKKINVDYIFSSNIKRFCKLKDVNHKSLILSSNVEANGDYENIINYASYTSNYPDIIDNSGLMLIKFLISAGVKKVSIAGMDGYSDRSQSNYYDSTLEYDFSNQIALRNELITKELQMLKEHVELEFITPTEYVV